MSTLSDVATVAQDAVSDRDAFLASRRTGIGGSDAAAVVGLNPYKTAYDLYLEKRGEIEPADLSDVAPVKWGLRLEDAVAEEYMERTGNKVHRVLRTLRHPEHPFMIAHLDRRVVGEKRGLEIKTAGQWAALSDAWGPSGTDQVPEQYLIQTQHYMGVTGYEVFDLAVLIAGSDFRIYHIARDEEIVSMLIDAERDFWRRVEIGEPPTIATVADARKRFPLSHESTVEASAEAAQAVADLRVLGREKKALEEREDALQTIVMRELGDADTLMHNGRKLCTWKTQTARRFSSTSLKEARPDVYQQFCEDSQSRVFRLAKEGA